MYEYFKQILFHKLSEFIVFNHLVKHTIKTQSYKNNKIENYFQIHSCMYKLGDIYFKKYIMKFFFLVFRYIIH